jgi:hypothetical protein
MKARLGGIELSGAPSQRPKTGEGLGLLQSYLLSLKSQGSGRNRQIPQFQLRIACVVPFAIGFHGQGVGA